MASGIYEILNLVDGSQTIYVGSSQDIRQRWHKHKTLLSKGCHYNLHLQRAWDKYGEAAFAFGIIEQVPVGKLAEREQFWLDYTRAVGPVYNVGTIADAPNRGRRFSEASRRKMSASQMGSKHTAKARAKIGTASSARKRTGTTRARVSASLMGHSVSIETREKIAKPHPAFIHRKTGEVIPAGHNLSKLCIKHSLDVSAMCAVAHGRRAHHKGWTLDNARLCDR